MKAYIATGVMGSFAFDGKGKLIAYRLFPKKTETIAEKLSKSREGETLPEEKELAKELEKKGFKDIISGKEGNIGIKTYNSKFRELAIKLKFVKSQAELNEILTKVNIELTKGKLKEVKRDKILMHAVSVLDETDSVLNVFSEKLREWYGLYFPEAAKEIESHEKFARIVSKGRKENIGEKTISKLAEKSAGMEFSDYDLEQVKNFSENILKLYDVKKSLTKYIEKTSRDIIPNLSAVAGPLLASRLLVLAGGLEKISKLPSSTIQLLGAEKALFRHLKGGGKAPKYGILFSHPLIQKAPKESKGKAARLVASKLSLAAKLDNFSKKDEGESLRKDLDRRINEIR